MKILEEYKRLKVGNRVTFFGDVKEHRRKESQLQVKTERPNVLFITGKPKYNCIFQLDKEDISVLFLPSYYFTSKN